MGNNAVCGCGDDESRAFKKNPKLANEFKASEEFMMNYKRLNFQFRGDLEDVWKVEHKQTHEILSLHEKDKEDLLEQRAVSFSNLAVRENAIIVNLANDFIVETKYACQTP